MNGVDCEACREAARSGSGRVRIYIYRAYLPAMLNGHRVAKALSISLSQEEKVEVETE